MSTTSMQLKHAFSVIFLLRDDMFVFNEHRRQD